MIIIAAGLMAHEGLVNLESWGRMTLILTGRVYRQQTA